MGTTYAIWTGIGAVGTLALGILRLITQVRVEGSGPLIPSRVAH